MPITQILLTARGGVPAPTYTLSYAGANNVNEGSSLQFNAGGTNIINGTYYWTIETNAGDFLETDGSFNITDNSGSFTVTPTADATTEGLESFTVALRTGSISGPIVASSGADINDTSFAVGGSLVVNGSTFSWATTNAASPTYGAYTYPDNSSGSVHTLTGTQYVLSPQFGVAPTLNFNLWFYPTANDKVILGELGQAAENSSWHLSMLEIDSSNKLKGRVWQMPSGVTSTGSVNLNAWNHVYFYYDHATTTFGMSLNNETAVTSNIGAVRQTSDTNHTYWGIGLYDPLTNMGSGDRYQGKFDGLVINTSIVGSNYEATKSKYNRVSLTSGEALGFNGTNERYVIVSDNQSDWNLGNNWTIEWWQKIPTGAGGFMSVLCQDANVPTYSGIDVFVNAGNIQMFNGNRQMSEAAAPRDQWNHIAIQNNAGVLTGYINGVAQSFSGPHNGTIVPSSPLNVCIGSRTYDGGINHYGQYFNGQLANIRISSIARYSTTFTPPLAVAVDANTKLALDGSVGGGGMLIDEASRHTLSNNGATIDTIV